MSGFIVGNSAPVRRASGNSSGTICDILALPNLIGWLSASHRVRKAYGPCTDGDLVWYAEERVYRQELIQSAANDARRPSWVANAVNGRPGFRFNTSGLDDQLVFSAAMNNYDYTASGMTIIAAGAFAADDKRILSRGGSETSAGGWFFTNQTGLSVQGLYANSGGGYTVKPTDFSVFVGTWDQSTKRQINYVNGTARIPAGTIAGGTHLGAGVLQHSGTPSYASSINVYVGNRVGADLGVNGTGCDYLFFDGVISTNTQQLAEGQLCEWMNRRSSLPLSHPYYVAP